MNREEKIYYLIKNLKDNTYPNSENKRPMLDSEKRYYTKLLFDLVCDKFIYLGK